MNVLAKLPQREITFSWEIITFGTEKGADGYVIFLGRDSANFFPIFPNPKALMEGAFSRKNGSTVKALRMSVSSHKFTHFQHHKELTSDEFLRCDKIFIRACFGPNGKETNLLRRIKTIVPPYAQTNFLDFVAEFNTMLSCYKGDETVKAESRNVPSKGNSGNVVAEAKPEEVVNGEISELNDEENTNLEILRKPTEAEGMAAFIEKPGMEELIKLYVISKGPVRLFKAIRKAEREVIAENSELAMEDPEPVGEAALLVGEIDVDGAALPGEAKAAPMLARKEADVPLAEEFPVIEAPMEEAA
ncbi:MAG: hypothetical protein LBF25_01245 [Puniceicoccales bacterium]|jgi:hypothetical protein|nr:hypothetical protein [Puniceicoccales bacterium]